METIIIQTESKSVGKLLVDLAKRMGEKAQFLDKEIAEDLALGEMMRNEKTGRLVPEEAVLAELIK